MQGNTWAKYDSLRSQIIHSLAQDEDLIDFGEKGEDIKEGVYDRGKTFIINNRFIYLIYRLLSFSQLDLKQ